MKKNLFIGYNQHKHIITDNDLVLLLENEIASDMINTISIKLNGLPLFIDNSKSDYRIISCNANSELDNFLLELSDIYCVEYVQQVI